MLGVTCFARSGLRIRLTAAFVADGNASFSQNGSCLVRSGNRIRLTQRRDPRKVLVSRAMTEGARTVTMRTPLDDELLLVMGMVTT